MSSDADLLTPQERRAAYRASWDVRIVPLLSAEWQSSATIAQRLGAKNATVLERLKDLLQRGIVERRIVERPPKASTRKRKRRRVNLWDAEFRLAPGSELGTSSAG